MSDAAIRFEQLVSHPSPWLSGDGPHADLVVSTRVRLARNLAAVPFTHRAREEQLRRGRSSPARSAAPSFLYAFPAPNERIAPRPQILVERSW